MLNDAQAADMHVEARSEGALRFWLGDCCEQCADGWLLTFISCYEARLMMGAATV